MACRDGSWQPLAMSRIQWPDNVEFERIDLEPAAEDRVCEHCGRFRYVCDHRHRYLRSLGVPLHIVIKICCCPDKECPGHAEKIGSDMEMAIAPPCWTLNWDMFAWMGHRRYARHWSVPQICAELKDRFGVKVSPDLVEDYTAKYEGMVAAWESDLARMVEQYRHIEDLILCIDGLQPEKGHETLYVVRELRLGRVWFAEPLLSSAAGEVKVLIERARSMAERIGKPVRCWMSDKQDAFVTGVRDVFPDVPHRYCANHFLRDAAKPMLEADSHAKVQMRRKVRGLRKIERRILERRAEPAKTTTMTTTPEQAEGAQIPEAPAPATETPPVSEPDQVVLDDCAATRGILNDDQGGPLHPPGVRMVEALQEVHDSLGRALKGEKGGPTNVPSSPSPAASNGKPPWSRRH